MENKLKRELPIELQLLQVLQIPWTSMNILRTISRLAINQTEYWCTVGEFWNMEPIFPHCWNNNNLCIYSKVQPWQVLNILHVHHTPSSSIGRFHLWQLLHFYREITSEHINCSQKELKLKDVEESNLTLLHEWIHHTMNVNQIWKTKEWHHCVSKLVESALKTMN